ncbi:molybdate ABC transporter substrate-binding protein [Brevibacterium sp. 50QC2O2]|jgi:molybdate transport system substrate-binding protein|uniref:molybdate ABC transporter substrate-binding protein n=1 Tax=Brevibacterium TaxID=1696 RepID=UPI00211CCFF3|nr:MULTISPECIES: molybdate ABC transporter substrate-binding protein [unclassified Brevibacterium]MCQ9368811.1 molybdate ABC transporter substrate-binding protein [Brevibacterium sp. 91QC2O2]MCQ9386195.1 molybdate ABC transporter substrate-binding protein [Brevibacterium sp. 68QC2CO]MCQ9388544.1 molybdate ABC transporter substrate-binding protein [Brevibacterium sp. 50QC2O2]
MRFNGKRTAGLLAGLAAAGLLLSACGQGTSDAKDGNGEEKTLTVFAAASLTQTFDELGKTFEGEHPGVKVRFSYAGSSELVTQIQEGAPADVFASADEKNMQKATDAKLMDGTPVPFATNVLTIATAPDNPKKITGFKDLTKDGTSVVVCAEGVPCGNATKTVEDKTGVKLKPVSEESKVTDVLGKVQSGQADAGLVYVTDAKGAGDKVTAVDFPESDQAVNTYPIGVVKDAKQADLAREFQDMVTGEQGQKVLGEAGFGKP